MGTAVREGVRRRVVVESCRHGDGDGDGRRLDGGGGGARVGMGRDVLIVVVVVLPIFSGEDVRRASARDRVVHRCGGRGRRRRALMMMIVQTLMLMCVHACRDRRGAVRRRLRLRLLGAALGVREQVRRLLLLLLVRQRLLREGRRGVQPDGLLLMALLLTLVMMMLQTLVMMLLTLVVMMHRVLMLRLVLAVRKRLRAVRRERRRRRQRAGRWTKHASVRAHSGTRGTRTRRAGDRRARTGGI